MATIRFFIQAKEQKTCHIYVRLSNSRKSVVKCKTGLLVEPDRWSNDTETIRQRIHTDTDKKLIASLKGLKDFIDSENRFSTGDKTKEWLQNTINKFHGIKDDMSKTMNGYIEDYIVKAKSGEIKNKGGMNFAKGTITNFRGFQRAFLEYQGIYSEERLNELAKSERTPRKRMIVDFEDITIDFYHSFVAYMSNEGYKLNTMDKFIGILKYFMRKSLRGKKHSNREFMESAFSGFDEDSHAVYLNLEEIDRIYKAEVSDGHERARDAFIVLCETALRISDYKKVPLAVKGNFIHIHQTKTSDLVVIPLTPRMKAILDKYKGKLPVISEQKVNEYIKNICRDCKINEVIQWTSQKKGMKYTASAEKWELVTCHTGRRSAATNMYLSGIPIISIMKITGHKSEKTFLRYIRITEEESAKLIATYPFFAGLKVV